MPDAAPPHPAAEPRQSLEPSARNAVVGGIVLAGATAAVIAAMAFLARRGPVGLLAVPPLAALAVLLAWASAVQLGGGTRFDDHPWV